MTDSGHDEDVDEGTEAETFDAELDSEEVARMVEAVRPNWTVVADTPIAEGTDATSFATVETGDGRRECVVKAAAFVDPPAFRVEPRILDLVDRRTGIPAPSVIGFVDDREELGDASADVSAPFFLMERAPGEHVSGPDALSEAALSRVARDAGRHLGELHAVATFDGYGGVRAGRDADCDPTVADLAVPDSADDWPSSLRGTAEGALERIEGGRFADLLSDLRTALDAHLDAVPTAPEPIFMHGDYRLGNLLVDPETGAVRTVLDWGNHFTGHAEFDLVGTEQHLCGRVPLNADRRRLVREGLEAGYAETNDLSRGDGFEATRRTYLFVSQLWPLAWFDLWYGGSDDAAAAQRELMRSLLP